MPRVRLRVREAQPAEDPPGAGLRQVTACRALVQAGDGHRRRRPDHRGVVPVQPGAGRVDVGGTAAEVVQRREVGLPAVLARVVGQQRRWLCGAAVPATARFRSFAVRPDAVTVGRTVRTRRRRRRSVLRPALRRDGNHRQQPRPLRPGPPVHILRKGLLPEVRAQDSHQVKQRGRKGWKGEDACAATPYE